MKCRGIITIKQKRKEVSYRCNEKCFLFFCQRHWVEFLKLRWRRILKNIILFGGVAGAIFYAIQIRGCFKSEEEKEHEKQYITGILAPYGINKRIKIEKGQGERLDYQIINDALDLPETFVNGCLDANNKLDKRPSAITLKLQNGKFLISLTLYDIVTGDPIVEIIDNSYEIDREEKKNFFTNKTLFSTANALEIEDKHGLIIFSMWVDENSTIQIRGYFRGLVCTEYFDGGPMISDPINDPEYKTKSIEHAMRLKPKFLPHQ